MEIPRGFEGSFRPPEMAREPFDLVSALGEDLGFKENMVMVEMRAEMIRRGMDDPGFFELYGEYQNHAEEAADSTIGIHGRIALTLKNAEIKQSLGAPDAAREDYDDALTQANAEGLSSVVDKINLLVSRLDILDSNWPAELPKQ